jgi:hypothetical protein
LYQHAEHYFRLSNAHREGNPQQPFRPAAPADVAPQTGDAGSSGDGINREEPGMDDDTDS